MSALYIASLQYDTLYVDKKCYKYNPVEGRVVEHTVNSNILRMTEDIDSNIQDASLGDRPGSVLGRLSPFMMGPRLGISQTSPTKQRRSPTLYRSTSFETTQLRFE